MKNLNEFIDYVFSFYGPGEMYANFFNRPVTKAAIKKATLVRIQTGQFEGDSFDREAVRDIILKEQGVEAVSL